MTGLVRNGNNPAYQEVCILVTNYAVTGGTGANARINVLTKTVDITAHRRKARQTTDISEKIGQEHGQALAAGSGIGALAAGQWIYASGNLYVRLTGDAVANATNQVRAHYVWEGAGAGPLSHDGLIEDASYRVSLAVDFGTVLRNIHLRAKRDGLFDAVLMGTKKVLAQ